MSTIIFVLPLSEKQLLKKLVVPRGGQAANRLGWLLFVLVPLPQLPHRCIVPVCESPRA